MTQIEINSFFTQSGSPALDIDGGYPKIRIWEIDGNTHTLVVGEPSGIGQDVDGTMSVVGDGFYTFLFTDLIGYDESKKYLIRVDGGPSLNQNERYQSGYIDPGVSKTVTPSDIESIADATSKAVWDTQSSDHLTLGSTGLALNQIRANIENLTISTSHINELVTLLLKYEANRTRVDTNTKQLIVYDDDGTTILRAFKLYDARGNASTDSITERVPISESNGGSQPVPED